MLIQAVAIDCVSNVQQGRNLLIGDVGVGRTFFRESVEGPSQSAAKSHESLAPAVSPHFVEAHGFGLGGNASSVHVIVATLQFLHEQALPIRSILWVVNCLQPHVHLEELETVATLQSALDPGIPLVAVFNTGLDVHTGCKKQPHVFIAKAAEHDIAVQEVISIADFTVQQFEDKYPAVHVPRLPDGIKHMLLSRDARNLRAALQRGLACLHAREQLHSVRASITAATMRLVKHTAQPCKMHMCDEMTTAGFENCGRVQCVEQREECKTKRVFRITVGRSCTLVCAREALVHDSECLARNAAAAEAAAAAVQACMSSASQQQDECIASYEAARVLTDAHNAPVQVELSELYVRETALTTEVVELCGGAESVPAAGQQLMEAPPSVIETVSVDYTGMTRVEG